ncbi:hypothetical protein BGZ83_004049 [Gryganskiella cystojenkinii]|nr:hypothetical protein BGZ83_004049 [Gryganskiella cystojenkinii]
MDYEAIEAMVDAPFQKSPQWTLMAMRHAAPIHQRNTVGLILGNATTPETGMEIDRKADATVTPDRALLVAQGTTETMATIPEITVTTGTTEITETEIIGSTGTAEDIGILAETTLVNIALAEAEVPGAMGTFTDAASQQSSRRRRSPSPPADDTTCDRRTVFVMQLSARLRSSELEEFFSQAGKVRAARVIEDRNTGRSKGVGYVEFYEEESVAKAIALTGQKLLGIPVIAKHTESEKNRLALQAASQSPASAMATAQPAPVDMSQYRLYVGSLNFDMTEDELQRELEKIAPLEYVKLHRDVETGKSKGFAFVQYKDLETAKKAMAELNGQVMAGRTIKVGLVTEKGSNAQNNNSYQYNNSHINNSISIDDSDTAGYTSHSRADLMQKLARGDVSLGAIPSPAAEHAPVSGPTSSSFIPARLPVVMPSRSVLLKNMFTDDDKTEPEWAKELEEDVKEEAEKNGPVVHIHVEQDSPGEIYLKFDSVQSATNAVQSLGGRFFAGRQIIAAYLPEMLYNVRFPRAANV